MANVEFTDLTELAEAPASNDLVAIYDTTTGVLKKITPENLIVEYLSMSAFVKTLMDDANATTFLATLGIVLAGDDNHFPSGTVMAFGQNSAPTGWTRLTTGDTIYDAATDNAMFCFAKTGDISQGGSVDPQSTHSHNIDKGDKNLDAAGTTPIGVHADGDGFLYAQAGAGTDIYRAKGNTEANTAPYYVELILAKKD